MDPNPDYLVCDDENCSLSLVQKAGKENIPIISREEFAEKSSSEENPMEIKKVFKHHLVKTY